MATLPRPDPPRTAVIGRAQQKEQLTELLAMGSRSKRGAMLVGAPGAGKTTLLRWAFEQAVDLGRLTAFVRVPAAAGLPPRFPIGELLEGLVESCDRLGIKAPDPLKRVLDTLRGTTSAEEYPAALPQIANALEVTAERAPLALFIDDYHSIPHSSSQLLTSSLASVQAPLALLCSSRLTSSAGLVTSFPEPSADLWVDRILVDEMSLQEIGELAERVLGGELLPSLVVRLEDLTNGNPLFVVETLRSWSIHKQLTMLGRFHSVASNTSDHVPASIAEALAGRLPQSDSSARQTLSILAVRGRETSFGELLSMSGRDPEQLLHDARILLRLQLVAETSDSGEPRYRIAHPSLEHSLLELMSHTDQAAIHTQIYHGLRNSKSATSSELAHHATRSLAAPAELESILDAAAAQALTVGSMEEAAGWFSTLASVSRTAERRIEAQMREAEMRLSFDSPGASALFTSLLQGNLTPGGTVRALKGRARAHRIDGRFEAAIHDLRHAQSLTPGGGDFELYQTLAILLALVNDFEQADEAVSQAERCSETANQEAQVLGVRGSLAFCRSDFQAAHRLWEAALRFSTASDYRVFLLHNLSWSKILLGEWEAARTLLEDGIQLADQRGDVWNLASLLASFARLLAWKGLGDQAVDAGARAVHLAESLENPVATIDAYDGLGVALLESGNPNSAYEALSMATRLADGSPELREIAFTHAIAGLAALEIDRPDLCEEHLSKAREHLQAATFWAPLLRRLEVMKRVHEGDYAGAGELALEGLSESQLPFESGRLHQVAAIISLKLSDREGAKEHLRKACQIFDALGTSHAIDARASLKHIEVRLGRPRSRQPLGLTPRELDVLELISKGLTNKQIAQSLTLSPATIKTHVERVIAKLGVSRRSELARQFIRVQESKAKD